MTLTPASMVSLYQKCYIAHCFNYLALMNTMVLLTIPWALCDADAIAKFHMTETVMLQLILSILN